MFVRFKQSLRNFIFRTFESQARLDATLVDELHADKLSRADSALSDRYLTSSYL
jgi:hypothetical protein